jgi:hypothetical protein
LCGGGLVFARADHSFERRGVDLAVHRAEHVADDVRSHLHSSKIFFAT